MKALIPRIAVFLIAYIMKLTVDKKPSKLDFAKSLLDMPVNVNFLALSFLVAFSLVNNTPTTNEYTYYLLFMIVSPLTVLCSNRANDLLENNSPGCALILGVLNFGIVATLAAFAINENIKYGT